MLDQTRQILREEFENRKKKNAKFSQRGFAQKLKISPATLSGFLAGKRALSLTIAKKIATDLKMSPEKRKEFLLAFDRPEPKPLEYKEISIQDFENISHWSYYAFLNLIETTDFEFDANKIAERMGLTSTEVKKICADLIHLGLIQKEGAQLKRTYARIKTEDQVPSETLKNNHRQSLNLVIEAMNRYSIADRDNTSITMAINPEKLTEAKACIRRFQDEISELLETGNKTSVYQMCIHLYPLIK